MIKTLGCGPLFWLSRENKPCCEGFKQNCLELINIFKMMCGSSPLFCLTKISPVVTVSSRTVNNWSRYLVVCVPPTYIAPPSLGNPTTKEHLNFYSFKFFIHICFKLLFIADHLSTETIMHIKSIVINNKQLWISEVWDCHLSKMGTTLQYVPETSHLLGTSSLRK